MEMNVENIVDGILNMDPSALLSKRTAAVTGGIAVTAVIAVLMCFLGLKLIRVWNVLAGLLTGAAAGLSVSWILGLNDMTAVIITGAAALVLGVLGGIFKKFGVFIYCLSTVFSISMAIIQPENWVFVAVCAGIGLIAAIVTMLVFDPFVIIITSINGGAALGVCAAALIGTDNSYITLAVMAALALVGIGVQSAVRYREVAKKEVRHARAIKEEISKEQEVEQLRTLLDDDEEDE